jgi:hypothetical protein
MAITLAERVAKLKLRMARQRQLSRFHGKRLRSVAAAKTGASPCRGGLPTLGKRR